MPFTICLFVIKKWEKSLKISVRLKIDVQIIYCHKTNLITRAFGAVRVGLSLDPEGRKNASRKNEGAVTKVYSE